MIGRFHYDGDMSYEQCLLYCDYDGDMSYEQCPLYCDGCCAYRECTKQGTCLLEVLDSRGDEDN